MSQVIFISYTHDDGEEVARKVFKLLEDSTQFTPWWDVRDIETGHVWEKEIKKGLDACVAMVVIITPGYAQSLYCAIELSYAMHNRQVPIIPIRAEGVAYADVISTLRQIQLLKEEDVEGELLEKLQARIAEGTPIYPRSRYLTEFKETANIYIGHDLKPGSGNEFAQDLKRRLHLADDPDVKLYTGGEVARFNREERHAWFESVDIFVLCLDERYLSEAGYESERRTLLIRHVFGRLDETAIPDFVPIVIAQPSDAEDTRTDEESPGEDPSNRALVEQLDASPTPDPNYGTSSYVEGRTEQRDHIIEEALARIQRYLEPKKKAIPPFAARQPVEPTPPEKEPGEEPIDEPTVFFDRPELIETIQNAIQDPSGGPIHLHTADEYGRNPSFHTGKSTLMVDMARRADPAKPDQPAIFVLNRDRDAIIDAVDSDDFLNVLLRAVDTYFPLDHTREAKRRRIAQVVRNNVLVLDHDDAGVMARAFNEQFGVQFAGSILVTVSREPRSASEAVARQIAVKPLAYPDESIAYLATKDQRFRAFEADANLIEFVSRGEGNFAVLDQLLLTAQSIDEQPQLGEHIEQQTEELRHGDYARVLLDFLQRTLTLAEDRLTFYCVSRVPNIEAAALQSLRRSLLAFDGEYDTARLSSFVRPASGDLVGFQPRASYYGSWIRDHLVSENGFLHGTEVSAADIDLAIATYYLRDWLLRPAPQDRERIPDVAPQSGRTADEIFARRTIIRDCLNIAYERGAVGLFASACIALADYWHRTGNITSGVRNLWRANQAPTKHPYITALVLYELARFTAPLSALRRAEIEALVGASLADPQAYLQRAESIVASLDAALADSVQLRTLTMRGRVLNDRARLLFSLPLLNAARAIWERQIVIATDRQNPLRIAKGEHNIATQIAEVHIRNAPTAEAMGAQFDEAQQRFDRALAALAHAEDDFAALRTDLDNHIVSLADERVKIISQKLAACTATLDACEDRLIPDDSQGPSAEISVYGGLAQRAIMSGLAIVQTFESEDDPQVEAASIDQQLLFFNNIANFLATANLQDPNPEAYLHKGLALVEQTYEWLGPMSIHLTAAFIGLMNQRSAAYIDERIELARQVVATEDHLVAERIGQVLVPALSQRLNSPDPTYDPALVEAVMQALTRHLAALAEEEQAATTNEALQRVYTSAGARFTQLQGAIDQIRSQLTPRV